MWTMKILAKNDVFYLMDSDTEVDVYKEPSCSELCTTHATLEKAKEYASKQFKCHDARLVSAEEQCRAIDREVDKLLRLKISVLLQHERQKDLYSELWLKEHDQIKAKQNKLEECKKLIDQLPMSL